MKLLSKEQKIQMIYNLENQNEKITKEEEKEIKK